MNPFRPLQNQQKCLSPTRSSKGESKSLDAPHIYLQLQVQEHEANKSAILDLSTIPVLDRQCLSNQTPKISEKYMIHIHEVHCRDITEYGCEQEESSESSSEESSLTRLQDSDCDLPVHLFCQSRIDEIALKKTDERLLRSPTQMHKRRTCVPGELDTAGVTANTSGTLRPRSSYSTPGGEEVMGNGKNQSMRRGSSYSAPGGGEEVGNDDNKSQISLESSSGTRGRRRRTSYTPGEELDSDNLQIEPLLRG
jgi:hypothetical protein